MPSLRTSLTVWLCIPVVFVLAGCGDDPAPRGGDSGIDMGGGGSCLPLLGACYARGAGGCCIAPGTAPSCDADGEWRCPTGMDLVDRCQPCADDWASCASPSECTLAANSCCGSCGRTTLESLDGVNVAGIEAHRAEVCPVPQPCPSCPSMPNPDLFATCATGRCTGFDVRTLDASACSADSDCRVRVTACCECGGDTSPFALIAVSDEGAYAPLVCDPGQACPECAPTYPDGVSAACGPDGHCIVVMAGGG